MYLHDFAEIFSKPQRRYSRLQSVQVIQQKFFFTNLKTSTYYVLIITS